MSSAQKSAAYDIAQYLESEGLGKLGVDLFTVMEPEGDDFIFFTLLHESPFGNQIERTLDKKVSDEVIHLVVNVYSSNEDDGRTQANRVQACLEEIKDMDTPTGTRYMIVLATDPVRLLGCDRTRRYVHEQTFRVMRKQ